MSSRPITWMTYLVVSAALVPYPLGTTFDLLPAGATGSYWADGLPLGSTISR